MLGLGYGAKYARAVCAAAGRVTGVTLTDVVVAHDHITATYERDGRPFTVRVTSDDVRLKFGLMAALKAQILDTP